MKTDMIVNKTSVSKLIYYDRLNRNSERIPRTA